MRITTAIVLVAIGGFLYAGQIVSVVNLGLAQRLGLQERPDHVDPLFTSLEVWTARWDLVTLIGLPITGVLMLLDNSWWPYIAMISGGLAADTGGREIAKYLGLGEHNVRMGTPAERRVLFAGMTVLTLIGVLAAAVGLIEVV